MLVGGRLGTLAWGLYALALVLTHAYFPRRYFQGLLTLDAGPVWLLAARNAAFVALAAVLAAAIRPGPERSRTPSLARRAGIR